MMRAAPPRFIWPPTYTLFFHRFPVVPAANFWHNPGMPTCAEKNAELPHAVLPVAHPDPAPAATSALSANDPNASPRPREIDGPSGPEPTRFGDWERKGRCIDF
jgi:hypothetical protein